MCRQYLAYKIPTSHFTAGKCEIPQGGRLESCSCGKFTYAIVGRYRSKPDIIFVSKTSISKANKLYKKLYPFRVFKISKGFKDGCCKTCGSNQKNHDKKIKVGKMTNLEKKKPLDIEQKLEMDLDSIIRYELNLNPYEQIPEDSETGCSGDSVHKPFITKKKLDRELDNIDIETWKHFSREVEKSRKFNNKYSIGKKEYDLLYFNDEASDHESEEVIYL